jgi:hypothetical protein
MVEYPHQMSIKEWLARKKLGMGGPTGASGPDWPITSVSIRHIVEVYPSRVHRFINWGRSFKEFATQFEAVMWMHGSGSCKYLGEGFIQSDRGGLDGAGNYDDYFVPTIERS